MSTALVIGNGESRLKFDYKEISYNTLIGCNAIHRDIIVDHLVCCDRRMVHEAVENPKNKNTLIYVRPSNFHYFRKIQKNKNIRELPPIPFEGEFKRDKPEHWGSGPYAILVAANSVDQQIILLGFNLYSQNEKVNNVYKGTNNYNDKNSKAVDHSYWVHQIVQVFRYYPDKEFLILNQRDWQIPREWQLDNVQFKNFEEYFLDNKYLCN